MTRKLKVLFLTTFTILVVLYLEIFSYLMKAQSWVILPKHYVNGKEVEPFKVLIVADPQIQGEEDEPFFLGIVTRWDSDRYLQRTYGLAKNHVKPDAVIFLGDLFDEGSKAHDAQYRRYLARFQKIFDLPRKQDPSATTYIYIPGDNDVGGEGLEAVSKIKLKWFNQTFNDYQKVTSIQRNDWDVQFLQYHKFLPEYSRGPSYGMQEVFQQKTPSFRVIISHVSMLSFISESVQAIVDIVNPSLILSAHDHRSTYYKLEHGSRNSIHTSVLKRFLMSSKSTAPTETTQYKFDALISTSKYPYFRFNMNKVPDSGAVHEINVPTCSYRMGVPDMGYGYLQMYSDGTADYTVLWSPSRFYQLYSYVAIYILMKIIGTTWVVQKFGIFAYRRCQKHQLSRGKLYHSV